MAIKPTQPTNSKSNELLKLRKEIEQEVNAVAVNADRTELPPNMGILIPSLDLQKTIDRLMDLFATHSQQTALEAQAQELQKYLETADHNLIDYEYILPRIKTLKAKQERGQSDARN